VEGGNEQTDILQNVLSLPNQCRLPDSLFGGHVGMRMRREVKRCSLEVADTFFMFCWVMPKSDWEIRIFLKNA
jgi:hypothetical protein